MGCSSTTARQCSLDCATLTLSHLASELRHALQVVMGIVPPHLNATAGAFTCHPVDKKVAAAYKRYRSFSHAQLTLPSFAASFTIARTTSSSCSVQRALLTSGCNTLFHLVVAPPKRSKKGSCRCRVRVMGVLSWLMTACTCLSSDRLLISRPGGTMRVFSPASAARYKDGTSISS